MSNKMSSKLALTSGLLTLFMIIPLGGLLRSIGEKATVTSSLPPKLGPFIDIWSGDSVNNSGPKVAYNDLQDEYLIVWVNERTPSIDIYARRVGGDGSVRSWFALVADPGIIYTHPVVAYSPKQERYLIVYVKHISSNNSDIWARFVNWDGSLIGNPFPIRQDPDLQRNPDIAYNSQEDEFLVIYENGWAGGLHDISAQRVKASDGSLLSWRNIATGLSELRTNPSVAYNQSRNEYLIVYIYRPVDIYQPSDVYGKLTSANMGTLSNELIISDKPICEENVSVGVGPDEYLVVWADRVCGINDSNIYARRLKGDGSLIGPSEGFPITMNVIYQSNPSVAFGKNHAYLVVWRHVPTASNNVWDVYGRYVMPGHDKAADSEFEISNFPSFDSSVDVGCEQSGNCLVVMDNILVSGGDLEIQGRMVMAPKQIYLPTILHRTY